MNARMMLFILQILRITFGVDAESCSNTPTVPDEGTAVFALQKLEGGVEISCKKKYVGFENGSLTQQGDNWMFKFDMLLEHKPGNLPSCGRGWGRTEVCQMVVKEKNNILSIPWAMVDCKLKPAHSNHVLQSTHKENCVRKSEIDDDTVKTLLDGITLIATHIGPSVGRAISSYHGSQYDVHFYLELENFTNKFLSHKSSISKSGFINVPPTSIKQGQKEAMTGHKTGGAVKGCFGTVGWEIGDTGKEVVVMYSVPYSFDLHVNWLGVGIFHKNMDEANAENMYNGPEKEFRRKKFYRNSDPLIYPGDDEYFVEATMGQDHTPEIKVKLFPKSRDGLAANLLDEGVDPDVSEI